MKFYGNCNPRGLEKRSADKLTAAQCARLGRIARATATWKAYHPTPSTPSTMPTTARKTQRKATKRVTVTVKLGKSMTQQDAAQKAAEIATQFSRVSTHHYDHATRSECNMLRGKECNRCSGLEQYAIDHPEHTHAYHDYPCTMLNGQPCSKCRVAVTV